MGETQDSKPQGEFVPALSIDQALVEAGMNDELRLFIVKNPNIASAMISIAKLGASISTESDSRVTLQPLELNISPKTPLGDVLETRSAFVIMREWGFRTVRELGIITETELARTTQVGPKTIADARQAMLRAGVSFRPGHMTHLEAAQEIFGSDEIPEHLMEVFDQNGNYRPYRPRRLFFER